MAEGELESLRRRKLLEMRRRLLAQKPRAEGEKPDTQKVLDRFLVGRAWEVLEAARLQYPEAARRVEEALIQLISAGRIRERITGEELYGLFQSLGLRVRLKTRIQVLEHGTLRSLAEKMREEREA